MSTHRYISTTIPYVNAPPHLGFALELVQADALARYHRALGTHVRFQTGTDENAFKNAESARRLGQPVRELVDRNADRFRALADALLISTDRFVRTATPEHRRAVEAFLARIPEGDLCRSRYEGRYCPGCEEFILERDAGQGAACPDHGPVLIELAEENVYFRLSRYQDAVHDLIESGRLRIVPDARRTEVLRFIERGLQDISISRDADRSGGWGLPYPGDPSQVVYVWIDALVNYLTGLGFPDGDWGSTWAADVPKTHVIGKNVWKFHAVYWPALLLAAGLLPPDELIVHGFLTKDGQKISKSRGDAADPLDYVRRFGADAVRYFLLRHVRPFDDSDFTEGRLEESYQAELANGLGNLASRLTALCERFRVSAPPAAVSSPLAAAVGQQVEAFRFDRALDLIWSDVDRLNREIAQARPWEADPNEPAPGTRAELARWSAELRALGAALAPFLPRAASLLEAFAGAEIRRIPPLFPRAGSPRPGDAGADPARKPCPAPLGGKEGVPA
jgi:methionyl-tRNA synthetase